MRSKRSIKLDRARVSLKQKHEVRYAKRIAKDYLDRYSKLNGGTHVTIRLSSLRKFCKFILKLP